MVVTKNKLSLQTPILQVITNVISFCHAFIAHTAASLVYCVHGQCKTLNSGAHLCCSKLGSKLEGENILACVVAVFVTEVLGTE